MNGSGGGRPPKKPRRSSLSAEDRSLWQHVVSSVDRKRQGKPRVPDVEVEVPPDAAADAKRPGPPQAATPSPTAARKPKQVVTKGAATPSARSTSQLPRRQDDVILPTVDRRKARRIAAGAIEIEARLDLHGMTQSAAHARLIGFVQSAVARGLRTVLVITGKGSSRQKETFSEATWWDGEETGVLRRSVPRWLAEPPLRAVVIGCQPASPRHGGEGALYVLLRRRKPDGRG